MQVTFHYCPAKMDRTNQNHRYWREREKYTLRWAEREGTAGQERKINCFTLDNILDSMLEFCKGSYEMLVKFKTCFG